MLTAAGIIFQYYSQIFVATYQTREIVCDGQTYVFRKLKPTILTNPLGIKIDKHYSIASKERAFLDIVYLNKKYHFDNLEPLDWNKVYEILPIYQKDNVMKDRVNTYYDLFKKDQ